MTELFEEFQEFRKILCVCPCCGDIVRISDLKLKVKGDKEETWLDKHQKELLKMLLLEEKFECEKEELRKKAQERGRQAAQEVFNNAISPALRKMNYDPFDVKPIFYPIDFLVFNGMTGKRSVDELILLSKISESAMLNAIRTKIESAVVNEQYDWQEAKIEENGQINFK